MEIYVSAYKNRYTAEHRLKYYLKDLFRQVTVILLGDLGAVGRSLKGGWVIVYVLDMHDNGGEAGRILIGSC